MTVHNVSGAHAQCHRRARAVPARSLTTVQSGQLAVQRSDELARCLEILGVDEHHWLGHRDGGCAEVSVSLTVGQLCTLIVDTRPQTVLTFGPDGVRGIRTIGRCCIRNLDEAPVRRFVVTGLDRSHLYTM